MTAFDPWLRDTIERLDLALLTLHLGDETACAIEGAAAFLRELCFENGDSAMNESPTFVCEFSDGETTRMTTWCASLKNLDVARGVRLARHAYRQRKRAEPPAIVTARHLPGASPSSGAVLSIGGPKMQFAHVRLPLPDIDNQPPTLFAPRAPFTARLRGGPRAASGAALFRFGNWLWRRVRRLTRSAFAH